MRGKGLTIEAIVDTAAKLVEERGYDNFTVRDLAVCLNVRAASLYNHIESVADVNREVGRLAANRLSGTLRHAIKGKRRQEALAAAAYAYRGFAQENPELYRAILGLPTLSSGEGNDLGELGRESFRAIRCVLQQYNLSEIETVHISRCLRSALHGFVTMQADGYYTKQAVSAEDSFSFLVQGFTDWVLRLESQRESDETQ